MEPSPSEDSSASLLPLAIVRRSGANEDETNALASASDRPAPGPHLADDEAAADKSTQVAIGKRTIDFTAPYIHWFQARLASPFLGDQGCMPKPRIIDSMCMLPPVAYVHMPASSVPSKLVNVAWTKGRNPINAACWTPGKYACMTQDPPSNPPLLPFPCIPLVCFIGLYLQMAGAAWWGRAAGNTLCGMGPQ